MKSWPAEVNESLNRAEVSLCLQQAPAPASQKTLLKQEQAAHGSHESQVLPMFIFLAQPQLCQLLLCALCWPVLPPMSSHVLASLAIPNCSAGPLRALNPTPSSSPNTSGLYLLLRTLQDHFGKEGRLSSNVRPSLGGSSHKDVAAAQAPAIPIP